MGDDSSVCTDNSIEPFVLLLIGEEVISCTYLSGNTLGAVRNTCVNS